jgi:hypothetical protein
MEKLLEDALIKVSAVVSRMNSMSVRDMLEALIAGERDPRRLAVGRGKMRLAALVEALSGRLQPPPPSSRGYCWTRSTLTPDRHLDAHRRVARSADRTPGPAAAARFATAAASQLYYRAGRRQRLADPGVGPVRRRSSSPGRAGHGGFPTAAHLVSWGKLSRARSVRRHTARARPARALPEGRARRGRRGRRHRHLPRRTLPAHRQASRQTQGWSPSRAPSLVIVWSAQRPDGAASTRPDHYTRRSTRTKARSTLLSWRARSRVTVGPPPDTFFRHTDVAVPWPGYCRSGSHAKHASTIRVREALSRPAGTACPKPSG